MSQVKPSVVKVEALKSYPPSKPADQSIQDKLSRLWSSRRKFIIMSGPPGVGKTRAAEDYVDEILKQYGVYYEAEACRISTLFPNFRTKVYSETEIRKVLQDQGVKFVWDLCVLHPQYAYEDLIRGYRAIPDENSAFQLRVREGVLGFIARVVEILQLLFPDALLPQGVLIMDEINRAPIGQLFGEAIYALDRRDLAVSTPYELEGYGSRLIIPAGLILLGTMNSVDRAIAGFDFALRRRFASVTLSSIKAPIEERFGTLPKAKIAATRLYDMLNDLVTTATKKGVVPLSELVLGHAYFLPPLLDVTNDDQGIQWLAESYQFQILPILVDYQEQGLVAFDELALSGLPYSDVVSGKSSLGSVDTATVIKQLNSFVAPSE
jgi:5-methylcytosine-specific restriction enzyme B